MIKLSAMNTGPNTAVWVITRNGIALAGKLKQKDLRIHIFLSDRFENQMADVSFSELKTCVAQNFDQYPNHVFIMAAGIVIRVIAGLIKDKTVDPAVVSMDDTGTHVISLLSGHLGGANELAVRIAEYIGAVPVISTATDMNRLPSIDMVAKQAGLVIENPEMIKQINMAFLENQKVSLSDPYGMLKDKLPEKFVSNNPSCTYGIVVDDRTGEPDASKLYLRPRTLSVGIGCNRGTPESEIKALLEQVFTAEGLSLLSISNLATIDIKQDETGILNLGKTLGVPLVFYTSQRLDRVETIKNSSKTVKKYTGAKSVCEAAAILASEKGRLIVEKNKTQNVTLAVARQQSIFIS